VGIVSKASFFLTFIKSPESLKSYKQKKGALQWLLKARRQGRRIRMRNLSKE